MNRKTTIIVLGLFSSAVFFSVFFTGNDSLLGLLAGFATGLFYIQWLFRDAKKSSDHKLSAALRIYQRGFFFRLGMVTLIVAIIGRFNPAWLSYLVIGIAVGVAVPLVIAVRQQLRKERR